MTDDPTVYYHCQLLYAETMEKPLDSDINLLPGDDLEKAPLGKFLKWTLTYGRYIIVITEIIVLLAFLSRFKLDRDLSDLSDNITRKKNIIDAAQTFETKVRRLQDRLTVIAPILDQTGRPKQYLELLATSLPQDIILSSLKTKGDAITLSGTTTSEGGIATVVSALQKNSRVRSVSLDVVSKDSKSNLLTFSLSLTLWP